MKFTVIYEKGPTPWGAYVPDLPGVISVGDTREEVELLIQEAIEFHLGGMGEIVQADMAPYVRTNPGKPAYNSMEPQGAPL